MDWETGVWRRSPGKKILGEVTIAGDWAPIRAFDTLMRDNPESVYGDLLPILRESDLRMVNLECPLIDEEAPVSKSGTVLKGRANHITALTAVPFEVATLANNHVCDHGPDALIRTQNRLQQNGIQTTGAGLNLAEAEKPLIITVNGIRIGIISFSEGEDLTAATCDQPGVVGWEVERIIRLVKTIRPQTQLIIVVCHAGVEYIPFPPPYVSQALIRIAEAGADLVIGHHPHVPQGVQIHKGVPICYSLGNFVFFQPTDLLYRKIGYLVKAQVAADGLAAIRIIPYSIGNQGLRRLNRGAQGRFFKKMAALSAPLTANNGITDAWHGFLKAYGVDGFKEEVGKIMTTLETDPPKGAAMFRNRLTTLQHSHHLIDLMTRIMDHSLDDAPDWAVEAVADYFNRKVTEGLPV